LFEIQEEIKKPGDGYEAESQGLDYFSIGKDKEGLTRRADSRWEYSLLTMHT
jgi:hypothetical protein